LAYALYYMKLLIAIWKHINLKVQKKKKYGIYSTFLVPSDFTYDFTYVNLYVFSCMSWQEYIILWNYASVKLHILLWPYTYTTYLIVWIPIYMFSGIYAEIITYLYVVHYSIVKICNQFFSLDGWWVGSPWSISIFSLYPILQIVPKPIHLFLIKKLCKFHAVKLGVITGFQK
jgi:hypothetical protein